MIINDQKITYVQINQFFGALIAHHITSKDFIMFWVWQWNIVSTVPYAASGKDKHGNSVSILN